MAGMPKGRPGRFAAYEALERELPPTMKKRPMYVHGIGLFRGERGTTAWVKINLRKGGLYRGKSYAPGQSVEIKLGSRESWTWPDLDAERDRLQKLADHGKPLEDAPCALFKDYAETWLQRRKPAVRGYGVMAGHVRKHLNPTFGAKNLADIGRADVNRWIAEQRQANKATTVQRQMNTLKAILNDAVKAGLISDSPTRHADVIKGGAEGRTRTLKPEELDAMYKAADRIEAEADERTQENEIKGWLRDFLRWALQSGMRRQEILNLRFQDFQELPSGRTRVLVEHSKSGQPRWVTCSPEMIAIRERMKAVRRADDDNRLFPVSLTTAKRKLTKLWKSCGLEDVRLHDLRRTHITQLIHGGVDLRTVAGRVGHKDLTMLEKHYAMFIGDEHAADMAQDIFITEGN